MKDLMQKTFTTLTERISSPFLSSFIISWPIINYKLILALIGGEEFHEKIKYIEVELHPTDFDKALYYLLYPLFYAIFYTIIYPFLDIAICYLSEKINNLKAQIILSVQRKTPIDENYQAQYFKQFDEEKENNIKLVKEAQDREKKEIRRYQDELVELKKRLRRQVLLRFCGDSSLTPENVEQPISQDKGSLSELRGHVEMIDGFKKLKDYPSLVNFAKHSDDVTFDSYERKIISSDDIRRIIKCDDESIIKDFIEVLFALNLVNNVQNSNDQYEITNSLERLRLIKEL